jgi:hypothetical protein
MTLLRDIVGWLFLGLLGLVAAVCFGGALFFELCVWRPPKETHEVRYEVIDGSSQRTVTTKPGSWRHLLLMKLLFVPFLTLGSFIIAAAAGSKWGVRAAATLLVLPLAATCFFFSWVTVSSRGNVGAWFRGATDQDDAADSETWTDAAFMEGPGEAAKDSVMKLVLSLPFGWLAVASLLAALGADVLVGIRNVWANGSYGSGLHVASVYNRASAPLEHVASYVFFGGALLGNAMLAISKLRSAPGEGFSFFGGAAVCAALIAIYVFVFGAWT